MTNNNWTIRCQNAANPLPGERVFGFITTAEGIKIHRHDCPNAVMLQGRFANRVMKATLDNH